MSLNEQIKFALKNNNINFIKHLVEERGFDFSIYNYYFVEYASKKSNSVIWNYILDNIDYSYNYESFAMNIVKRNNAECLEYYLSKGFDLSFENNRLLKLAYHKELDNIFYLLIRNDKILNAIKKEKEDSDIMSITSPWKQNEHKENSNLCKKILERANVIKFKEF